MWTIYIPGLILDYKSNTDAGSESSISVSDLSDSGSDDGSDDGSDSGSNNEIYYKGEHPLYTGVNADFFNACTFFYDISPDWFEPLPEANIKPRRRGFITSDGILDAYTTTVYHTRIWNIYSGLMEGFYVPVSWLYNSHLYNGKTYRDHVYCARERKKRRINRDIMRRTL